MLEKAALDGLDKYGVGSCGPRGFYGTVGEFFLQSMSHNLRVSIGYILSHFDILFDLQIFISNLRKD